MSQTDVEGDGYIKGSKSIRIPTYNNIDDLNTRGIRESEGRLVWLKDTKKLKIFNNSQWIDA
jgi:hypothetical protein